MVMVPDKTFYRDVVVIGKARHGKDTVASMLTLLDPSFKRVAFADKLKDNAADVLAYACDITGLSHLENGRTRNFRYFLTEFQENKELYRPFFQWFGTEFIRGLNDNYWVDVLNAQTAYRTDKTRLVLTDARFPNEIEGQLKAGALVIKVTRPTTEIEQSNHDSETLIDTLPYHIEINNSGSLAQLLSKVEEVYSTFLTTPESHFSEIPDVVS